MRGPSRFRLAMWHVAAAACCVLLLLPTRGFAVAVGMYTDQRGTSCDFQSPPLGDARTVYLIVHFNTGTGAAQFALSMPTSTSYAITNWRTMAGLSVGDPESGVMVAFGAACLSGDLVMAQFDLMRVGDPPTDCYALRFEPHPESLTGRPEFVDCAGQFVAATAAYCLWLAGDNTECAVTSAPSAPSPPDGDTDVGIDALLNATVHSPDFCCPLLLFGSWVTMYFGTEPDPPSIGQQTLPYDPPSLVPATTYYWRMVYHNSYAPSVSSPVWSFTTQATTPVTMSTWGAIKALYR